MWTQEHVLMCSCVCACVSRCQYTCVLTCDCRHVLVCVQIGALVHEGYPGAQVLILRKWRSCQGKKGKLLWSQV